MAQKFTTPGVIRKEVDLSQVISPAGTSTGVVIGGARQGIANSRQLIGTDKEQIVTFGIPVPDWTNDRGIYGALQYLQESSQMFFTRATDGTEAYSNFLGLSNANSAVASLTANATSAYLPSNQDANDADTNFDLDNANNGGLLIASIGPGVYGNNIGIKITTSANDITTVTSANSAFASTSADVDWKYSYDSPESDGSASSATDAIWKGVFKVDVFTRDEESDSFPNAPTESFLGFNGDKQGSDGSQLNIEQVVNGISKFIYVNNDLVTSTLPLHTSGSTVALVNGADSASQVPASQVVNGFDFYTDREKVFFNILIGSFYSGIVSDKIAAVVNTRVDAIGTVQVGASTVTDVQTLIDEGNTQSFANPSYIAKYVGWSLIQDSFNDKKVFIPNSIFGAVVMARTDRLARTWNAPAGLTRGILPVLGQNVTFNDTQIGNLYNNNLNAVKFHQGTGNVLWGQRTAQRKVTALREIAVRRLLLFLENTIEPDLLSFIFEPNLESVRLRIFSIIDGFMSSVQAAGGVVQYNVVVDETNNTPDDVDNNILNVDLYIIPTRTIEFIQLQLIITRSGVNLAEVTV